MSTTQFLQPSFIAPHGAPVRIRPAMRRAGAWIAVTWRVLMTRRALLGMDERMLKDIGVSRTQATYEATRWLWHLPQD